MSQSEDTSSSKETNSASLLLLSDFKRALLRWRYIVQCFCSMLLSHQLWNDTITVRTKRLLGIVKWQWKYTGLLWLQSKKVGIHMHYYAVNLCHLMFSSLMHFSITEMTSMMYYLREDSATPQVCCSIITSCRLRDHVGPLHTPWDEQQHAWAKRWGQCNIAQSSLEQIW